MKRIMLSLMLMLGFAGAASAEKVVRSSFTNTFDTGYIEAENIVGIVVGVATAGGHILIVNSTFTLNATVVSSISLATANYYDLSDVQVKGIYYRTFTPTNGVTILYRK